MDFQLRKNNHTQIHYLAKHRDTLFRDLPFEQILFLSKYALLRQLERTAPTLLSQGVMLHEDFVAADLYGAWVLYCKQLEPKQKALATFGMLLNPLNHPMLTRGRGRSVLFFTTTCAGESKAMG
jgi:hypothetical protein